MYSATELANVQTAGASASASAVSHRLPARAGQRQCPASRCRLGARSPVWLSSVAGTGLELSARRGIPLGRDMAPKCSPVRKIRRRWRLRTRCCRRLTLASVTSLIAGGIGSRYIAGVDLIRVNDLVHWDLPYDAMLLLIITIGIVVIILGWRVIVYFERRDQHDHEIISGMRDQEGVYQRYENGSSTFTRWPVATRPPPGGQNRPGQDQSRGPSSPPCAEEDHREHVLPLNGRQPAAPVPPAKHGIADPGPARDTRSNSTHAT
jgi:hypothetical protein